MNMHYYALPIISTKKFVLASLLLLSVLLAAYGPMASYSQAQSAVSGKLDELKTKITTEIDRRIANYEKTMASLNVDVHIAKDDSTANVSSDKGTASASANKGDGIAIDASGTNGANATFSFGKDGITGNVELPSTIQDKVKAFQQKMLDQLKALKDKVTSATSLESLQGLAQNVDAQFGLDQLTQVQSTVTQAVESMTGVLDKLKTTFNDLQGQVTAMKDCKKGLKSGETTLEASASSSGVSVNCGDLNYSSEGATQDAQSKLDGLKSIVSTISSVVGSVVTLLMSLVTQFGSMLGGLGSLGDLGNLGNISNLLGGLTGGSGGSGGAGGLSSLTGSLSSITGLLGSFSAITSQLDLTSVMSGGALGNLSSLTSLINLG